MAASRLLRPVLVTTMAINLLAWGSPQRVDAQAQPAQIAVMTPPVADVEQSDDGLFRSDAAVGNTAIRFVVDTGANFVILTARDAHRAGVAPVGSSAAIRTAGGRTTMRWAMVDNLVVGGASLGRMRVGIVRDGVSLFGQNALGRLARVTIADRRLTLHAS